MSHVRLITQALITAGIVIAAPGPGLPAVQGDPAARAEVDAAFQRFKALTSYRMKATSSRDGSVTLYEFVQPDKSHVTVRSAGAPYVYEVVTAGKQSAARFVVPDQPPAWECHSLSAPQSSFVSDLDRVHKDLETIAVVRKPDTVVEGTPVHAYADAAGAGTFYIGIRTGLPRRSTGIDKGKGETITLDFYDYNAKITIVLPPCK